VSGIMSRSITFFDAQFRRQVTGKAPALNPFELAVLPFLAGRVLDYGCGLGGLALAAARQGCSVLALDASPTAIGYLRAAAAHEGLAVDAFEADLRSYAIGEDFDSVVSIGLLMFMDRPTALHQRERLKGCVRPRGVLAINVLVEGTTYLDMFDPAGWCLFGRSELQDGLAGWEVLFERFDDFPAPGATVKSFVTLMARKR
jgi:tellurite methyltransferase